MKPKRTSTLKPSLHGLLTSEPGSDDVFPGDVDHVARVFEDGLSEGVASVVDVRLVASALGEVIETSQRMQQTLALNRRDG